MPRKDRSDQNALYNNFITESVKNLKKNKTTIIYRKYQFHDIAKKMPNDILSLTYVDNYYIVRLINKLYIK